MQEEMISKKQLLEQTGISYGQLYRWKRKGLIPEEWFIRKSTYTGQETFFPRVKVLTRISKINDMKEDVSLDDLAQAFSPAQGDVSLTAEEVVNLGIANDEVFKLYIEGWDVDETLSFNEILSVFIFHDALCTGNVSLGEGHQMLNILSTALIRYGSKPFELFLVRKLGVFICFAASLPVDICFDTDTKLVVKYNIQTLSQELKLKFI